MTRCVLFALLFAIMTVPYAVAQPIVRSAGNTLRWTPPTVRTDGTAFDMTIEGSYYLINWTRSTQSGVITVPKEASQFDITEFRAGATFNIQACDDQEPPVCSANSNTVKKSGGPPAAMELELIGGQAASSGSSDESSD